MEKYNHWERNEDDRIEGENKGTGERVKKLSEIIALKFKYFRIYTIFYQSGDTAWNKKTGI